MALETVRPIDRSPSEVRLPLVIDHRSGLPYLDRGRGTTVLVVLHGLCSCVEDWEQVAERLAERFRVVVPQLPLRRCPEPDTPLLQSIPAFTERVRQLLDSLEISGAALCGHSMGGQIAIDLGVRYPEYVDRLVLCASAGLVERSLLEGMLPTVSRTFVRDRMEELFYDPRHVTEALVDEIYRLLRDRSSLKRLVRAAMASRAYPVRAALHSLRIPTLLMWGEQDRITPASVAWEFERELQKSRVELVERCGHAPPLERPDYVAALLESFVLEGVGANGALTSQALDFQPVG